VKVDPRAGTPHVDEDSLLRGVYEVLSTAHRPAREHVSATARRRFSRSVTLGLLAYLAGGVPRSEKAAVHPADIELPSEWCAPLAEIARRDAMGALAWFWEECDHERFSACDDDFAAAVRRSLCVSSGDAEERAIACP
jgi:hypothetical protein